MTAEHSGRQTEMVRRWKPAYKSEEMMSQPSETVTAWLTCFDLLTIAGNQELQIQL